MGEKISGYPTEASALSAGDLIDVSKEISTGPSVYESQKANVSLLANWNIFGQDLTMSAPRLHNLSNNQLSLTNGRFLLKGSDDAATDLLTLENLSGQDVIRVQNDGSISSEVSIDWNLNNNTFAIQNVDLGVAGTASVVGNGTYSNIFQVISSSFQPVIVASNTDNNVAIGTTSAEISSILELDSTTKGFLKPRMTTTERDLITLPVLGLEIFNTTTNQTEFYNGSSWAAGAVNISNTDLTWTGDTIQDLDGNSLTFENGVFNIQGAGTSTGTTLALYDNDTTPNKTWEWLDSGDVNLGQPTSINTNNNNLNFEGGGQTKISNGSRYVGVTNWNTHTFFDINNGSNSAQFLMANASTAYSQDEFSLSVAGFQAFRVQGNTIALGGGFNKNSFNSSYGVNIGNSGLYSGGDIVAASSTNEMSFDFANYPKLKIKTSSNEWWMIEGNGAGSTFAAGNLYFYDATSGNRMLEFKAGGAMNIRNGLEVNGTAGFTGTGAYTNFTIQNGIITAAS